MLRSRLGHATKPKDAVQGIDFALVPEPGDLRGAGGWVADDIAAARKLCAHVAGCREIAGSPTLVCSQQPGDRRVRIGASSSIAWRHVHAAGEANGDLAWIASESAEELPERLQIVP